MKKCLSFRIIDWSVHELLRPVKKTQKFEFKNLSLGADDFEETSAF
jgi:hypothetical protein